MSPRTCLNVLPIPEFRGHLRTRADFERLVAAYDPETPGRYPPQWDEMVRGWQSREYPVGITAWRGMLQSLAVVGWKRLEDVMYGVYDHPHLIDETMEHVTHFMLSLIEQGLREVRFDFAILAEPIASWHGPVVGPKTYRRHVLPGLRRVVDRLRGAGIDIIVLQTHGAVKPLIPLALDAVDRICARGESELRGLAEGVRSGPGTDRRTRCPRPGERQPRNRAGDHVRRAAAPRAGRLCPHGRRASSLVHLVPRLRPLPGADPRPCDGQVTQFLENRVSV
jgi:hypothetical protein